MIRLGFTPIRGLTSFSGFDMLLAASTVIDKPINVGETDIELRLKQLTDTYNPFRVALYSAGSDTSGTPTRDFSANRLSIGPLGVVRQQPDERLRWIVDYSPALVEQETLQSVATSVSPTGDANPLIVTPTLGDDSLTVDLLISNGVTGTSYTVTVSVETSDNQVREDDLIVVVIA